MITSTQVIQAEREIFHLPTVEEVRAIVLCADRIPETDREAETFLEHAKKHLCNRAMSAGDVQAWYLIADAQKDFYCPFQVALNSPNGTNVQICGARTVPGKVFCQGHDVED